MKNKAECNYLIKMLKSVVNEAPLKEPSEDVDWDIIYNISQQQNLTPALFYAIYKLDNCEELPHFGDYETAYQMSLLENVNKDNAVEELKPKFNHIALDYMMLKGSITKTLYPSKAMRTMKDIDVYFKGADMSVIDYIMKSAGYEISKRGSNKTVYINNTTNIKIQMKEVLLEDGFDLWKEYLSDIWDYAIYVDQGFYKMSPESLYLYQIIRMAQHFLEGGIGMVHFVDVFMMYKKVLHIDENNPVYGLNGIQDVFPYVDVEFIRNGLEQCGLIQFELCVRKIAAHWFATKKEKEYIMAGDIWPTEIKLRFYSLMKWFVFSNGAYGTYSQQKINQLVQFTEEKPSFIQKIFKGKKKSSDKNDKKSAKPKTPIDSHISKTKELMEICGLV